jgi:hypothetical protein
LRIPGRLTADAWRFDSPREGRVTGYYRRELILPLMEDKKGAHGDASEAESVIPLERIAQIRDGENGEHRQGNDFLNGFQLCAGKFVRPDAIGRNLEAILKESDAPARDNYLPERRVAVFQMAVPREGHEDVGDGEKNDRAQVSLRQDPGL